MLSSRHDTPRERRARYLEEINRMLPPGERTTLPGAYSTRKTKGEYLEQYLRCLDLYNAMEYCKAKGWKRPGVGRGGKGRPLDPDSVCDDIYREYQAECGQKDGEMRLRLPVVTKRPKKRKRPLTEQEVMDLADATIGTSKEEIDAFFMGLKSSVTKPIVVAARALIDLRTEIENYGSDYGSEFAFD